MRIYATLALIFALSTGCATTPANAPAAECSELASLTPAARAEVLAIARILANKPRFALDFSRVGMHALSVGNDTMVTFATDPSSTKEDIIFYVPAKRLIRAGLDVKKFDTLPAPGTMEPGRWYYTSGEEPEPRFNNNAIGTPVLMMAVDSDGR